MTDPERISKRSSGLAAQLLRAGGEEQPSENSVEKALVALGVSSAVMTTSAAGAAAAGGAKLTKAVSFTLLAKWVGIGVVGGVGLASVAAVATSPAAAPVTPPSASIVTKPRLAAPAKATPAPVEPTSVEAEPAPAEAAPAPPASPHVSIIEPVTSAAPALEVGAPLAAEVAYVDRARALVASGQASQGLALLGGYEREFPEARLLPEVLFLELQTFDQLGRTAEARAAAKRLVDGFPKSPHASRARRLLFP
ncbi:MAG TPA: tetratricopeptide repeat protein [Polyangiaceae bacterium]|nr:tetratricopeptide repeat protein [Polyangiaceae bacterium]